ncbi:MAG: DUF3710 domain-containing protein [Nocardioidaceae bacterium]|nr:DUF3710 domain-containing protein [Nocardioidaceae bacterium]NUS51593.1 DUF3710 domain-containing protein [Nocardioidaceae bacterium]
MFRRRKAEEPDAVDQVDEAELARRSGPRADGPWDESEVERSEDDGRVDLGSLLVTPAEGLELQLQVDEASGQVVAVVLAGAEGAVELRAFAAPRNGDVWDAVRRQVSAEVARMGGTATEHQGPWGTELTVSLTMTTPDGGRAPQTSRVVGIPGPRWLLRATLFGVPAVEYRQDGAVETALRDVVVVRGSGPVPPGDPLPLTMPPQARRTDTA